MMIFLTHTHDGCSKFFIMDKLEFADPDSLAEKLTALRHELLADPYFAGVESFKPERPKTAHGFHAAHTWPGHHARYGKNL